MRVIHINRADNQTHTESNTEKADLYAPHD